MASPPKRIIILGAGVSGLQTAISLLTAPSTLKYKVTIIASHSPGDLSPAYTSPWAGGHWRSHASSSPEDAEARAFDKRTYEFWTSLIWGKESISPKISESGDELKMAIFRMREIGLGEKQSRNYWGSESSETPSDGSGLWWKDGVKDFHILNLEKEKQNREPVIQNDHLSFGKGNGGVPPTAVFGIKYQSICINVPKYLSWLFSTATKLGANVIKSNVDAANGLEGVVADAKRILIRQGGAKEQDIFALVNCTGLSAQKFVGKEEAALLYPIRGQTILVKGEGALARTCTDFTSEDPSELAYVIPRPGTGTTILGGCKQKGNWSSEVDKELSKRIVRRVKEWGLAEELRTGEGEEFEVISEQVGFRPGRKGGPRVEVEKGGKVAGVWVVHAYGHAGAGYQNSVGSAEKVVRLIDGCDTSSSRI